MNTAAEWFQHGVARQNAGDPFGAIHCYGRVIALGGKTFEVYFNLAFALQAIGKDEEALANYVQAVRLSPDFAEAHNNLGNIYHKREQLAEAQVSYEHALQNNPNLVQSHFNLGLVLRKRGAWTKAAEHFRAAWNLAPDYVEAWDNLRDLLTVLKRTEESLDVFLEFEKTAPPSSFLVLAGLATCRFLGDFEREKRYLELALNWEFTPEEGGMAGQLLGLIEYFDVEQSQLLKLYQRYNALISRKHFSNVPLLPPRRTRGEKLRVGYLSPDFFTNAMGLRMIEIFGRHDASRFEIYAYSLAEAIHDDAVTLRFRELSYKFVPIAKLDEHQAARLIAEDDLDILVGLGGQASSCKPAILAYKPARIQISLFGYHGQIGLDTVDYKLTDAYADLPETANFLLEDLLPVDGCIFPFSHVEPARSHAYSRTSLGLDGKVVFGAFVNIMKLSPRCLSVWRAILDEVEHAVLAFSPLDDGEMQSFIRQAKAAGITEEKIIFIPASKDENMGRARYSLVDIVLDTFPYSGGSTTLAALDMGVPVVTLIGTRHSERTSFSILKNLGLDATIAANEQEFISIVRRLVTDLVFRENVKEAIQQGMKNSPLLDMASYVHHLESAYLRAAEEKEILSTPAGKLSMEEFRSIFQNAVQHHQAQRLAEAEAGYRHVLEDQPEFAPAFYMLGMVLKAQGETDTARACFEQASRFAQRYADAWAALGRMDAAEGRNAQAIEAFRRALEIRPESAEILNDLALLLSQQRGQTDEAVALLRRAVAVSPNNGNSHFNLGAIYQKQGHANEAMAEYGRAILLQTDNADAYFNLGVLLQGLGRREQAAEQYRRVLVLQPERAEAYRALGEIWLASGKIGLWLENFKQYEQYCSPGLLLALYALETSQYLGATKKAERYLSGLLHELYPAKDLNELLDGLAQLLYLLLFFDVDERQMLHFYERYNEALKQAFPRRVVLPETRRPGKIRVGYLSADLRNHVMGKMMYQAISRHDSSRFEVYCYSLSHVHDEWTDRFLAASFQFVKLKALDEEAAAERIAQDELDILVDLSGHTQGALPGILAMKPARVQITHVASAGAVGCDAIDYKLTDNFADVPASQGYLIETLLPMRGCVYPYRHISPAREHGYSRERLGLPEGAVTLGAFVTLLKLSTRCLAVWRAILDRLPQAYLVFSPLSVEAPPYYLKRVKEAGIDASRVLFLPASADESVNQARYSVIDISLDPFPFGGANGTLEALDMGVPVVTLCGKRHGERSSFSILKNLGVEEIIAQSGLEYVEIVERLAVDPGFVAEVRKKIQTGLEHSDLVDMAGYTSNLESAYLRALTLKEIALS